MLPLKNPRDNPRVGHGGHGMGQGKGDSTTGGSTDTSVTGTVTGSVGGSVQDTQDSSIRTSDDAEPEGGYGGTGEYKMSGIHVCCKGAIPLGDMLGYA